MNQSGRNGNSGPNSDEKRKLFDKYVMPHYDFVKKLCKRYTTQRQDVDENFNDVLLNLYKYIGTYDESKDIKTWLHIVTKRYIFATNQKRLNRSNSLQSIDSLYDGSAACEDETVCDTGAEEFGGEFNDGIVIALTNMPTIHKKAFMMQMQGYSLKEIAKILNESGELESNNINTVKTRVFNARKYLREHIDREGNLVKSV